MGENVTYPDPDEIEETRNLAIALSQRAHVWYEEADAADDKFIRDRLDNHVPTTPDDLPNGEERATVRSLRLKISEAVRLLTQVAEDRSEGNSVAKLSAEKADSIFNCAREIVEDAESVLDGVGNVRW